MTRDTKGRFRRGSKRPPAAGRRKGTPNKVTRAVKEFLSDLIDEADVQEAVRERLLGGDTVAFFKAVEIVHGKPRQTLDVNQAEQNWIQWPECRCHGDIADIADE